jgi:hypothetical protein
MEDVFLTYILCLFNCLHVVNNKMDATLDFHENNLIHTPVPMHTHVKSWLHFY